MPSLLSLKKSETLDFLFYHIYDTPITKRGQHMDLQHLKKNHREFE